MPLTPYMEAAIEGELGKLEGCAGDQDVTMNNVAIALAGMVKGWQLDEADIRGQFFEACRSLPNLPSAKGKWTQKHFDDKWKHAMRDAEPRAAPNGKAGAHRIAHEKEGARRPKLKDVGLPNWTPPDEDGKPKFEHLGQPEPAKIPGELRRHSYTRDGCTVRVKIKYARKDGSTSWIDTFHVKNRGGKTGWQQKKPKDYVDAPYYSAGTDINPFDPELQAEVLYITEGEKDADTLGREGLCAFSCGSHAIDWSEQVKDRDVVIFGDNDKGGKDFAWRQVQLILAAAESVKLYTFPGLPDGGDVTDYISAHSVDELLKIVGNLPETIDEAFPVVKASKLLSRPAPERLWLVPDWIPHREVTAIGADGGTGKTTLALQLAVACALGIPWLNREVRNCPALYLSAEDGLDDLHFRLEKIVHHLEVERFPEHMRIVPLAGKSSTLAVPSATGEMEPTERFEKLEREIVAMKAGLVILDSTADVFGGNENDRTSVRSFITLLRGLAIRRDCTVVLLIHPSVDGIKTGRGYSGSTHWNNSVRSRMYFTNVEVGEDDELDPDLRLLELAKANRAQKGLKMLLRWKDHRFVVEQAEDQMGGFLRALECEKLFLELLGTFEKEGRPPSPNKSNNFVATLFSQHPKGKAFKAKEYRDAMNTLLGANKVEIVEVGPPSKRAKILVRHASD